MRFCTSIRVLVFRFFSWCPAFYNFSIFIGAFPDLQFCTRKFFISCQAYLADLDLPFGQGVLHCDGRFIPILWHCICRCACHCSIKCDRECDRIGSIIACRRFHLAQGICSGYKFHFMRFCTSVRVLVFRFFSWCPAFYNFSIFIGAFPDLQFCTRKFFISCQAYLADLDLNWFILYCKFATVFAVCDIRIIRCQFLWKSKFMWCSIQNISIRSFRLYQTIFIIFPENPSPVTFMPLEDSLSILLCCDRYRLSVSLTNRYILTIFIYFKTELSSWK